MKYLKKFENYNFIQVKELIDSLKDLSLELSDNNVHFNIQPKNDILIKILTLDYKNLLDNDTKVKVPDFCMTIYINKELKNKKGLFETPEWFKEFLYRLESTMDMYNFNCQYSVSYIGGDVSYFNNLEEIFELNDLIDTIKVDFKIKK